MKGRFNLPLALSGHGRGGWRFLASFLAGDFSFPRLAQANAVLLAQAEGGGGMESIFGSMAVPLGLTLLLMYFLLMRPEQKKRKEMEKLLSAVKKNDHVVTVGGILGTVVAAVPESKFVTIRVDDSNGTKLRVLRSAISHVGEVEPASESSGVA